MPAAKPPAYVTRFKEALIEGLAQIGLRGEVVVEPIKGTRLHRFTVIAPKFSKLRHSERQNIVWRIAEESVPPERQLFISMIQTLTPSEAYGREAG